MKSHSLGVTALAATILSAACPIAPSLWAQNSQDSSNKQASSSTITEHHQLAGSVNPSRTKLTREETGNRIVERRSVETMGSFGQYQPYLDIEKETVKVNATTVHLVERSYGRDADGRKQLVQVKEEDSRTLPGGEVETVRTTSNPDLNGGLRMVQKEVEDTKSTGPNGRETKTSVLIPDVNGGLTESLRVERREIQGPDHTVQLQQSTLVRDGSGRWQVYEVRQEVVKQSGSGRSGEEKVLRPGTEGNMVVVQRTVRKESVDPNGDSHGSIETDSVDFPGVPYDGKLHPVERVTSTQHVAQDGRAFTETQVEQPNPGSLASGMRVTGRTFDVVQPGPAGTSQETRTVKWLDGGGNLSVVSVQVGNSTKSSDH